MIDLSGKGATLPPRPPLRTDRAGYLGNQLEPLQRSFQNAVSLPPIRSYGLLDDIQGVARQDYLRSPLHREISK